MASRLLLVAGLWTALLLGAGGFLLSAVFRDFLEDGFDDRLTQNIDAMVGASEVAPEGFVRFNRPLADQRFIEPYSGVYWQVSTTGQAAFRSRSLWDQELDTGHDEPAFNQRIHELVGPDNQLLRIAERDIILPGSDAIFRYTAAADTAEIKIQMARFDRIVAWSLGGLGIGLLAAIALQVAVGLAPLRRIRSGMAAVRSGRAQRLDTRYPPEIQPLVSEVNAVLDHNDELVNRARTHVGNLAHALKTPLSVIANEVAAADNSKLTETIEKQATTIRHHVDHHLARARVMGRNRLLGVRADVGGAIADLTRALERIYQERHITFEIECGSNICFWGEREDLDEILGNLMDNAAKWAKSSVRVTARIEAATEKESSAAKDGESDDDWVLISIEDDGPGVSAEKRDALFERGERLDESVPGSGLGLAIVRDVTELCGGTISLDQSVLGGLRADLKLPATHE